jgi:hypothetical protein
MTGTAVFGDTGIKIPASPKRKPNRRPTVAPLATALLIRDDEAPLNV